MRIHVVVHLLTAAHVVAALHTKPAMVRLGWSPSFSSSGEAAKVAWAEAHGAAFQALDMLGYPPDGRWNVMQFTRELSRERSTALVARAGDELVAFASTDRVLDETSLLSIVVHPEWRGGGLARTLLLTLLCEARTAGQHTLTLEVRAGNTAAIGLYSQCGMEMVGRRPKYYKHPPPTEDAILFTAHLDDAALAADLEALVEAQPADIGHAIRRVAAAREAVAGIDQDGSTAFGFAGSATGTEVGADRVTGAEGEMK